MLLLHKQEVYLPPHLLQRLHPHSLDDMHVLATVAYSASQVHFCSAAAVVEDEQFGSELAVAVAEVVLPGSELVLDSEELFVSVADSNYLGSEVEGNP